MKGFPNSPLPVAMREDANADQGEQISHGSESDIGSIGVIIIGIEEEIQPKCAALPQEPGVLDLGDGHVVIPFSYIWRYNRVFLSGITIEGVQLQSL